jgi:hypothetical protein
MSAASQRGLVKPRPDQHAGDRFGVNRLSLVRCADNGKLSLIHVEVISGAGSDKWNCLNRFDRRASRRNQGFIAEFGEDVAVWFCDYDCAAVSRFDYRASPDFDQYRKLALHSMREHPTQKLTLAHGFAKDNRGLILSNTNQCSDCSKLSLAEAFDDYDLFGSPESSVSFAVIDDPLRYHVPDAGKCCQFPGRGNVQIQAMLLPVRPCTGFVISVGCCYRSGVEWRGFARFARCHGERGEYNE